MGGDDLWSAHMQLFSTVTYYSLTHGSDGHTFAFSRHFCPMSLLYARLDVAKNPILKIGSLD